MRWHERFPSLLSIYPSESSEVLDSASRPCRELWHLCMIELFDYPYLARAVFFFFFRSRRASRTLPDEEQRTSVVLSFVCISYSGLSLRFKVCVAAFEERSLLGAIIDC